MHARDQMSPTSFLKRRRSRNLQTTNPTFCASWPGLASILVIHPHGVRVPRGPSLHAAHPMHFVRAGTPRRRTAHGRKRHWSSPGASTRHGEKKYRKCAGSPVQVEWPRPDTPFRPAPRSRYLETGSCLLQIAPTRGCGVSVMSHRHHVISYNRLLCSVPDCLDSGVSLFMRQFGVQGSAADPAAA
jgi:hypothetical protein